MRCQNINVVFNFTETVNSRNLQNKSHTKFKAFTVCFKADYILLHTITNFLQTATMLGVNLELEHVIKFTERPYGIIHIAE